MNSRQKNNLTSLMLLLITIIWGYTFVTVKESLSHVPPFEFIGLRFLLASVVFLILFNKSIRLALTKEIAKAGLIAGIVFFAAYAFQTVGLQYTTATNAGFITGLFVVIVPFMSVFISHKFPQVSSFVGAGAAAIGLFLLTFHFSRNLNIGDILIFFCAIAVAYHMILLGKFSPLYDTYALVFIQMIVVSGLSFLFHFPLEEFNSPLTPQIIWSLTITGVLASALALAVQTYAQKYISPTRTAIILTMEPVFAGVFGYILLAEKLSIINLIGALFIIIGILISETNIFNINFK